MKKTPEGPVIYDSDRCMGCRYCLMACPYGIPRYEWEKPVPYVRKCSMCYDRLLEGKQPACVESCPEKAMAFGSRADLLEEAHRRIAADPRTYQNRVFGETEIGGTSVLYISDIPLDFLAYKPELGEKPLPELTLAALLKVPPLMLGMGAVMTGVYWIIGRRMKLATTGAGAVTGEGAEPCDSTHPQERKET
jgi:formate dehydrogenase iron-sulfur subunit